MNALLALVRADLTLHFTNRRALLISFVAPILIAGFFGATLGGNPGQRPARIPLAVVDLDKSTVTQAIVASMRKDENFSLQDFELAPAIEQVRAGKIRAAIVLPKGFGDAAPRALFSPNVKKPEIEIHLDPSQTVTMALVKGLLAQHVMEEVARSAFGGGPDGLKMLADAKTAIDKSTTTSPEDKVALGNLIDSVERLRSRQSQSGGAGNETGGFSFKMPFETTEREVTSGDRKYNPYAHSFAGMGVQFILFMGIDLGVAVLLMRRMGLWKRLRAAPVSRRLLLAAASSRARSSPRCSWRASTRRASRSSACVSTEAGSGLALVIIAFAMPHVDLRPAHRIDGPHARGHARHRDPRHAAPGDAGRRVGADLHLPGVAAVSDALRPDPLGRGRPRGDDVARAGTGDGPSRGRCHVDIQCCIRRRSPWHVSGGRSDRRT